MTIRGIGVDLVDVDRMRRSLARTPTLASRLFTDEERTYAERARDPAVEVGRTSSGAPERRVTGRAAELAAAAGVTRWLVTLSHTERTAEAVVVAEAAPSG